MFKASDYRISPFELESVLIEHPEFAELPKTISGKIRRVELRKAEDSRHGAAMSGTGSYGPRVANEFWEEDLPELKG